MDLRDDSDVVLTAATGMLPRVTCVHEPDLAALRDVVHPGGCSAA